MALPQRLQMALLLAELRLEEQIVLLNFEDFVRARVLNIQILSDLLHVVVSKLIILNDVELCFVGDIMVDGDVP